jgi:hypothetical protein
MVWEVEEHSTAVNRFLLGLSTKMVECCTPKKVTSVVVVFLKLVHSAKQILGNRRCAHVSCWHRHELS